MSVAPNEYPTLLRPAGSQPYIPDFPQEATHLLRPDQLFNFGQGRMGELTWLNMANFPPATNTQTLNPWLPQNEILRLSYPSRGLHPQSLHRGSSPYPWAVNLPTGVGNLDQSHSIEYRPQGRVTPQGGPSVVQSYLDLLRLLQPGTVSNFQNPTNYQDNVGLAAGGLIG